MNKKIASLISNILNPFIIGSLLILLISFQSTGNTLEAVKWSAILLALTLLPTYLAAVYLVGRKKMDRIFTDVRQQRTSIYIVTILLAVITFAILLFLKAPTMLIALCVTGVTATVLYTCINLWWKISLHAAFTTTMVTILVILFGYLGAISIVLIPLIVWSRLKLNCHTPMQLIAGALLAVINAGTVFYLFGQI